MNDKTLRSKRLHKSNVAALRQQRIARTFGLPEKTPHHYEKHKAMNCGNPDCILCMNPRKAFNEPTMQERIAPNIGDEF